MKTGFLWDEYCFWHTGGNFAFLLPIGGLVQPLVSGGLPENPESKRRLKNLLDVTGVTNSLDCRSADAVNEEDLLRVHTKSYIDEFRRLSAEGGGDLGIRTPFGQDGFEIASLSAGLVKEAVASVLKGQNSNAYALSRPPGHHCRPDFPMGFCLLANIAIAIEAAKAEGLGRRFAVVDWDVHHGNGTQEIFYGRDDILTISIHQEKNFPLNEWDETDKIGEGDGRGFNINIPLFPGAGHEAYLTAFDKIVLPAIKRFEPEIIIVASGFDSSGVDPLSRTLTHAGTFAEMTTRLMSLADEICEGRLAMAHEGGYSEVHVPFCGQAVIKTLAGMPYSAIDEDPLYARINSQQANSRFQDFQRKAIEEMALFFNDF